jgi:cytochrome c551/c552
MQGSKSTVAFRLAAPVALMAMGVLSAGEPETAHKGRFGYALIGTADDNPADPDLFLENDVCITCHERQYQEFQGSMHSASHDEPFYRRFAELAREEAGEEVYRYCSSCHAPAGVVTGLIPAVADAKLPAAIRAGVTCDVCHQISALTGTNGPWKQEANASFVLQPSRVKFGPTGSVVENRFHTGEQRKFFAKSEYCASCHTVIHPTNGTVIENTYGEWKNSTYAENGIQCQDCHMRSVEDAVRVAETLRPVVVKGQSAKDGPVREIYRHFFVGGNSNADRLANGEQHALLADARLKSAARIEVQAPDRCDSGAALRFEVVVHNVAAGHNIPTGVTELRQMWVYLRVADASGNLIYRSGQLDSDGDFGRGTIWFGALAVDERGHVTHKPWEMVDFLRKRTIPPKGTARDTVETRVPPNITGKIVIEARLLYRSVSPSIVAEVMGKDAFKPKIVQMAAARDVVTVN